MALISVVDDDESLRSATTDLLVSTGFTCESFVSAETFLESGRIADSACLVLDIRMPGMSGLDLQRHLETAGHATPIIFVTAFPEERARERALADGAVCYLPKPFSDQELLDCVHWALKRTGDQRELRHVT